MNTLRLAASAIFALATLCAMGYYVLCLKGAFKFLGQRKRARVGGFAPPLSILKPLRGTDPEMYESFRSHCLQDYPELEIIFGVSVADDPALPLVERLKAEFPQRNIKLIVCSQKLGANVKVSNLIQMLPTAHYSFLLINDSDIRLAPGALRRIMAPLEEPSVGLVTCLYRGIPTGTFLSRMEAVGISSDFTAGVLSAREVDGGIHFALGSGMAFRKEMLAKIGGMEPFVDYLADDYELGNRISNAGYPVVLSAEVVDTFLPPYDLGKLLDHQLRWARSLRDARPAGYVGVALTYGLLWAVALIAVTGAAPWALALGLAAIAARFLVAWIVGRRVIGATALTDLFILPLRDLFGFAMWCGSFGGNTIDWRGDKFLLEKGRLRRISDASGIAVEQDQPAIRK